jgi:hypothetical protein
MVAPLLLQHAGDLIQRPEALADEIAGGHPAFDQIVGTAVFDGRLPS